MPYIPHTEDEVREMLDAAGLANLDELWKTIPPEIRLKDALDFPEALAEADMVKEVRRLAAMNKGAGDLTCFMGAGTYHHYIPPAMLQLINRGEFFTVYTPYQPEVSQGTLQAIFEFQTMICELTGMEVANASMYDGASAAAEAVLMAERVSSKNKDGAVLIADSINPLYRRTVDTYLANSARTIKTIGRDETGAMDLAALEAEAEGALVLLVQHPNYFGCLEDLKEIVRICHEKGVLVAAVVSEALSMAFLEPPGVYGADMVVGEGQSLGIPMGFGGPHLGLFACRKKDMRKMPGRLVGQTVDSEGRRGFVLTLSTREQHIRRAKATSNICTNQGLMALAATIYLTLLGPVELRDMAAENRARTEYLKQRLEEEGVGTRPFSAPTFNEFVLDVGTAPGRVLHRMAEAGYLAGVPLCMEGLEQSILITVTEMVSRREMEGYVKALAHVVKEVSP